MKNLPFFLLNKFLKKLSFWATITRLFEYGFLEFVDHIVNDETFSLDKLPTSQYLREF